MAVLPGTLAHSVDTPPTGMGRASTHVLTRHSPDPRQRGRRGQALAQCDSESHSDCDGRDAVWALGIAVVLNSLGPLSRPQGASVPARERMEAGMGGLASVPGGPWGQQAEAEESLSGRARSWARSPGTCARWWAKARRQGETPEWSGSCSLREAAGQGWPGATLRPLASSGRPLAGRRRPVTPRPCPPHGL